MEVENYPKGGRLLICEKVQDLQQIYQDWYIYLHLPLKQKQI